MQHFASVILILRLTQDDPATFGDRVAPNDDRLIGNSFGDVFGLLPCQTRDHFGGRFAAANAALGPFVWCNDFEFVPVLGEQFPTPGRLTG